MVRRYVAPMQACLAVNLLTSVRLIQMEDVAQAKVNAGRVRIAADSALVVTGEGVRLEALDLDGALVLAASPGAPHEAALPVASVKDEMHGP